MQYILRHHLEEDGFKRQTLTVNFWFLMSVIKFLLAIFVCLNIFFSVSLPGGFIFVKVENIFISLLGYRSLIIFQVGDHELKISYC